MIDGIWTLLKSWFGSSSPLRDALFEQYAQPINQKMLQYIQKTGVLSLDGVDIATGYAGGNKGANPEGVNNPAMQNVPKVGPLPCGSYTLGAPMNSATTGPYSIPLIPDSANEMFSRSGFFIHGDLLGHVGEHAASEGCIIMPLAIRQQAYHSGEPLYVVSGVTEPEVA